MKSVKDKMYNYEVAPPAESWQKIIFGLEKASNSNIKHLQKRNRAYYLSLAAAAVIIMIFSAAIQFSNLSKDSGETAAKLSAKRDRFISDKIRAPLDIKPEGNLQDKNNGNKVTDKAFAKKYITIAGPGGQPVKISSKVASLIISSDNRYPPNPIWNEKVKKWKNIMKTNILAPATANFLDIVDLTYAVNDSH